MKTNHTKGEWEVETLNNKYKVATKERLIATINNISDSEANAKLIASAPELLKALIQANELLIMYTINNKVGEGSFVVKVLQDNINAIQKATE